MRQDEEWVFSDTLGVVRSRDGRLVGTKVTSEHPHFMELLCTWIRDASPFAKTFPFTSISLNYDYGAGLHAVSTFARNLATFATLRQAR